jgi:hypothetical protein
VLDGQFPRRAERHRERKGVLDVGQRSVQRIARLGKDDAIALTGGDAHRQGEQLV